MPHNATYPLPFNEAERLGALHQTRLLDSEPDAEFDAIVEDAKEHFGVPIALISLIDENRQWFKARCGLSAQETPRDVAFCAYAITQEQVMVVKDAKLDKRFKHNPLVTQAPYIRFYAGAPIMVPDGLALGTLCIIDTKPHPRFDHTDSQVLEKMACAVRDQILKQMEC